MDNETSPVNDVHLVNIVEAKQGLMGYSGNIGLTKRSFLQILYDYIQSSCSEKRVNAHSFCGGTILGRILDYSEISL